MCAHNNTTTSANLNSIVARAYNSYAVASAVRTVYIYSLLIVCYTIMRISLYLADVHFGLCLCDRWNTIVRALVFKQQQHLTQKSKTINNKSRIFAIHFAVCGTYECVCGCVLVFVFVCSCTPHKNTFSNFSWCALRICCASSISFWFCSHQYGVFNTHFYRSRFGVFCFYHGSLVSFKWFIYLVFFSGGVPLICAFN